MAKNSGLKTFVVALLVIVAAGSAASLVWEKKEQEDAAAKTQTVEVENAYGQLIEDDRTIVGRAGETTVFEGLTAASSFIAFGDGAGTLTAAEGGELIFRNLRIKDETTDENVPAYDKYLKLGGKLRFENCVFETSIYLTDDVEARFQNCAFESAESNWYSVWVADGNVKFTGCLFEGYRGMKIHEFADRTSEDVERVTIENCDFLNLWTKPGLAIGTFVTPENVVIEVKNSRFIANGSWDTVGSLSGVDSFYETDCELSTITWIDENNVVEYDDEKYWTDFY